MNDEQIETEIQAKGLIAPRVTRADIEATIASVHYFTGLDGVVGNTGRGTTNNAVDTSLGCLTFCVLVLKNGFTVTGESACASPENFDFELGKSIARRHAADKIWMLEGYQLKSKLAAASPSPLPAPADSGGLAGSGI